MKTFTFLLCLLPLAVFAQMSPDVIDPGFTYDRANPSSLSKTINQFEPETFYPSNYRIVVLDAATLKNGVQLLSLSAEGSAMVQGKTRPISGILIANKQGISPVPTPNVSSGTSAQVGNISPLPTPAAFSKPTSFQLFVAVPASSLSNTTGAELRLTAVVQEPGKRPYTMPFKVWVKR